MGILKRFKKFVERGFTSIDSFCERNYIRNWNENPDGSVDVDGDVTLGEDISDKLPFKFGKINGGFKLVDGGLKKMINFPDYVKRWFNISGNQLTNLIGSPKETGKFDASSNRLTSLHGSPKKVNGDYDVSQNNLTSLEGMTNTIYGKVVDISRNPIISPVGFPSNFHGATLCAGEAPIHEVMNLFLKEVEYTKSSVIRVGRVGAILKDGHVNPKTIFTKLYQVLNEYEVIQKEGDIFVVIYDRLIEAHGHILSISKPEDRVVEEIDEVDLIFYRVIY